MSIEKTQELCYSQFRMKMLILSVFILNFLFLLVFVLLGVYRTWETQHGSNQKLFLDGKIPMPRPDGFYKGKVAGYNGPWMGKSFSNKKATGSNIFLQGGGEINQYPFTTYVGKGLQDKNLDVLKIDYNISQNSFWIRLILDEVVEVGKNTLLGKIHIRLIPGFPFTIGFFSLQK